ncbi:MAG TPA: ECF-type sigma factor [Pyrinomonadaceae bacterium]|nr:ECF-type sigma factor [Pyrinomonadaceae bacterium]
MKNCDGKPLGILRRERPGQTLQTTDLIHEAYIRLVDQKNARWQNRAQFFGIAAEMMRRILVDHARARHRSKRGGADIRVSPGTVKRSWRFAKAWLLREIGEAGPGER